MLPLIAAMARCLVLVSTAASCDRAHWQPNSECSTTGQWQSTCFALARAPRQRAPDHWHVESQRSSDMMVCRVFKLLDACESTPAALAAVLSSLPPHHRPRLPALTRTLIRYSKRSDPAKALALYHCLGLLDVTPDEILARTVIDLCCKWNRGLEASQIVADLSRRGLRYSSSLYAGALRAISSTQHAQPRLAVEVSFALQTRKDACCGRACVKCQRSAEWHIANSPPGASRSLCAWYQTVRGDVCAPQN